MTDASRKSRVNTRGRPFPPGNAGKPKGARSRVTRAMEDLLEGEAEALTRRAVEMALAGDAVALRLCMDRLLPALRERPDRNQFACPDGSPRTRSPPARR